MQECSTNANFNKNRCEFSLVRIQKLNKLVLHYIALILHFAANIELEHLKWVLNFVSKIVLMYN